MYFCREFFIQEFGFLGLLLFAWMVASSLMPGAHGAILLTRLARRGESRAAVAVSILIAFAPTLVYLLLATPGVK